ncbi:MAG: glycosyl hydrolase repeat-containing protein [Verrucomicrobiales bacterium]|nr:glycosyl hydrolase repeat-containing protein [Verrucomicrobiales bacterium]
MNIACLIALNLAFVLGSSAADNATNAPLLHPRLEIERHLTLAPSKGNPRNSEGDFIRLKDGRWLFIYTHFTGGAADHASAVLASRESTDEGQTWSKEDKVVVSNEGGFNVMSVSLLRLHSGEIALFYLRKNSLIDCRPVLRISRDEARTWSEPTECIKDEIGYYILNNSRVIQLKGGRLVMPVALHPNRDGKLHDGKIICYLSDDSGKTWRRSRSILDQDGQGTRINFMEPGVVEVKKKQLLMTIRTKLGCQYFSESKDNGETWSTPVASNIFGPEAPATLAKIPATGDLLLLWNDLRDKPEGFRRAQPPVRNPLVAAISKDGGRTWTKDKILENEPGHGYCYIAVAFAGDRVLLGYCAHKSGWGLETTQISSFKVKDLYR